MYGSILPVTIPRAFERPKFSKKKREGDNVLAELSMSWRAFSLKADTTRNDFGFIILLA